jgi:hypothetical protein
MWHVRSYKFILFHTNLTIRVAGKLPKYYLHVFGTLELICAPMHTDIHRHVTVRFRIQSPFYINHST